MCDSIVIQTDAERQARLDRLHHLSSEDYAMLRRMVKRLVAAKDWNADADDLLHDALIEAFQQYTGNCTLPGFVYQRAIWNQLDQFKRERRRLTFADLDEYKVEHFPAPSHVRDDTLSFNTYELVEQIKRQLAKLGRDKNAVHPTADEMLDQLHHNVTRDCGAGVDEYDEPHKRVHRKNGLRPKGQRSEVITALTAANGCPRHIIKKRFVKLEKCTQLALNELQLTCP
ncbi:MAG: sigma-70 family RNA polymerase sigma factor [Chloroflexi bacterium]|nr:sigma-70 family RNA polymerase sigma factor [Chloroflexota bacterium]